MWIALALAAVAVYLLASESTGEASTVDTGGTQPFDGWSLVGDAMAGNRQVNAKLTGYWPFIAGLSASERLMEGGVTDRKGKPLHTLEMHLSDPYTHPYVSVSGDPTIWPYGQRISFTDWPTAVFRIVDTGSHFTGIGKEYRKPGYEPLDICVNGPSTAIRSVNVCTVYDGDSFDGRSVAYAKLEGFGVAVA